MCPFFLLPPRWEAGEAAQGVGGARPAALGLGDGREIGEKGEGDAGVRFPSSISEERARGEECGGHGRGGSAAAVGGAVGAARGGCRRGKRERVVWGLDYPPWLGLERSEGSAPLDRRRRRGCRAGERGRGVAARLEVVGVKLRGSAASFIGGQGGGAGSRAAAASTAAL
jgi:hypothetical protein